MSWLVLDLKELLKVENMEDSIKEIIQKNSEPSITFLEGESDTFWKSLKETGSELWLDTGDIRAAERLWKSEFSGMTTNNTLLNKEVQKGIYDDLIRNADKQIEDLDETSRVMEIAFILNAVHGQRLVNRFGCKVSVELHTGCAHDIEKTVSYAKRFYDICSDSFIIKIPLTPAGLIAARKVRERGIPVNFTLGFSARHNYVATAFARPDYVNVFLSRINSYIADNKLGDGRMAGEKATLASQNGVSELCREKGIHTKQIAASLRSSEQLASLAGVDVFTMPVKVAEGALESLDGTWESCIDKEYEVTLFPEVSEQETHLEEIWDISGEVREFTQSLCDKAPDSSQELIERAGQMGTRDLFPALSEQDLSIIASDGKIPVHEKWKERIKGGELAIDTLLNLAGLASFTADQTALDERIRGLVH